MDDPSSDNQPPTFLQMLQSVLAAAFGVQSGKNRARDFSHGKPSPQPPLPALGPGMRESWRRGERVDMGGARSLPKPPARSRRLKAVVRDGPGPHQDQ